MNQIPTWRLYALFIVLFLVATFVVSKFAHGNLPISIFFGMIVACIIVFSTAPVMYRAVNS